jgi:hypothetical protein
MTPKNKETKKYDVLGKLHKNNNNKNGRYILEMLSIYR